MVSSENSHIFKWKDFSEWKLALEGMFKDILTPELKDKLKKNRAIVEYCDHPGAFKKLSGQSIDSMITAEKINEFRQRYSHIRVYHGCRPVDVQSYYEKGLLLRDKDVQIDCFKKIFLRGKFPWLTEKMLQQSIERLVGYSDDDESHLFLDDRLCIERDSRYLIYGSEHLYYLVSNLELPDEKKEKCKSVLRKRGMPTIFRINLPNTTEYVRDNVIWETIQDMLTEWTSCLAHSRTESCKSEIGFSLCKVLPPEYICSDYQPPKITDRGKIYDTETGKYEDAT